MKRIQLRSYINLWVLTWLFWKPLYVRTITCYILIIFLITTFKYIKVNWCQLIYWGVIFWHNLCYTIYIHEREIKEKEEDEEIKYY
jgi:hypothetical protein